jgi:predicted amidophosphoribosyltransferase
MKKNNKHSRRCPACGQFARHLDNYCDNCWQELPKSSITGSLPLVWFTYPNSRTGESTVREVRVISMDKTYLKGYENNLTYPKTFKMSKMLSVVILRAFQK